MSGPGLPRRSATARRPGTRLRTLAARACSATTMERLVDPVVADLQVEYAQAVRDSRPWKGRWTLLVSYLAFANVMLLCGILGTRQAWRNWNQDDQRNLARVLWRSGLAALAITFLFEIPGLMRLPSRLGGSRDASLSLLIAYLVPAGLATSIPIGILIGTILGLAGRIRSRRLPAAVLLAALAISGASFVNVGWIVPAANQLYREELIGGIVPRAERELTLIEMRRAAEELRRWDAAHPDRERVKRLTFAYHQRYAIAGSSLTLTLLALRLAPRHRVGRMAAAVISCAAVACAVIVFRLGWFLSHVDIVSAPIGAWLLHIVAVSTTVLAAINGRWRNLPLIRTRA